VTTQRQLKANRANAKKSTGPRSTAGRAQASGNARRHGLTTPLPWKDVLRWYRLITDDPQALPIANPGEHGGSAALHLAETEAHLERCLKAERSHTDLMFEHAMDNIDFRRTDVSTRMDRDPFDVSVWSIWLANQDKRGDPFLTGGAKILIRTSKGRPAALHRRQRLLRRYRLEAEARRRKALQAWAESAE
jgi:hypothetical protein